VLIDEDRDTKFLVISKDLCPDYAVTDLRLALSMPPRVTACSGVDALLHAVESYISKGATPASELFALRAIELISGSILFAYENGQDIDIREKMQTGATMAIIAAMNSELGLCHAMAMPLCGLYHMPHGQAVGMALPEVLRYIAKVKKRRIKEVLSIIGLLSSQDEADENLEDGIAALEVFLSYLEISAKLSDFGFSENHIESIALETLNSAQCPTNPREPTEEDIRQLTLQMQ
jgi:alcohol dehydrogenase